VTKRLWRTMTRDREARLRSPQERRIAGRISGAAWVSGAAALLVMLALPGEPIESTAAVVVIAVLGLAWGAVLLLAVDWERAPVGLFHLAIALAPVAAIVLQPLTGGEASPVNQPLWLIVLYAAFCFSPWPVAAAWLACAAVAAAPLIYDADAVQGNLARDLLIVAPLYAVVAALIFLGREQLGTVSRHARELEAASRRHAEEQSSLRRVAVAVAAGSPPEVIFMLVSAEIGRLLGADAAAIGRYTSDRSLRMMGVWQGTTHPGQVLELDPEDELARVRADGAAVRIERFGADAPSVARRSGYHALVGAPVHAGPAIWGVLIAGARRPAAFAPGVEARLAAYADLIATAVSNAEDRSRLDRQAGVDELTGLPNHRAFRERLDDEISRARRHGRPLTVAVVDVDRYGEAADRVGPEDVEQALVAIGRMLCSVVRDEDVVARLGADEFGVAFVESDRATALRAAERARELVAATALGHGLRLTVSLGLCDLDGAPSAEELLRRADAALFWSKEHGRDRTSVYDAAVVHDLAGRARRRDTEREQGLAGLRALARAIDAKDPATQEHSERVATLAARMAQACGWGADWVERLREAALLHDVGKIGVPDAILLKPEPLHPDEWAVMRDHPALGARIVGDVLDEVQVRWIAAHHERPDGAGYPGGLRASEIPAGAGLIALADAWDSMVSSRAHSPPRAIEDALEECRALRGRQFTPDAIAALETLHDRGDLAMVALRMHRPTRRAVA
jgi:diguanylate cyclase (GGDEF)-like protein/putative nucleotidyltransferase with HDIG domain